jgi:hypothetical protein
MKNIFRSLCLLVLVCGAGAYDQFARADASAVWPEQSAVPLDPVALVRECVDLEVKSAMDFSYPYRYVLRRDTTSGVSVRQMMETRDGLILARTITWNGTPPKPEDRAKEDQRLDEIARSQEERAKKLKSQREDSQRVIRILSALPSSSLYTFDGREMINGRETIRLTFKPNPDFSPEAKETYLLKAAEGKMWIDSASRRLVRVEGQTTDSVNIGWGLLGHIDRGGSFFLEQTPVPGGDWRIREMRIDAKGKALLFKTIRIKQHQSAYDFAPVKPVSVEEAIRMLKQAPSVASATGASR